VLRIVAGIATFGNCCAIGNPTDCSHSGISAGLPELTTTQLVVRCRLPPRVAVATSVFVLAIAAITGAIVHALAVIRSGM
jgi:hypothetical protein